jgi:hypothetical protein
VLAPPEPLGQEDLVDAAAPDRDALLLVEVVPQAVERPAGEGQAELLRVGQGGGEDLGDLLRGVGGGPARAGLVVQAGDALEVEPLDPGVDGGARDAQVAGDGGGVPALGGREDDPGPFDDAGLGGAGAGEVLDAPPLLGR